LRKEPLIIKQGGGWCGKKKGKEGLGGGGKILYLLPRNEGLPKREGSISFPKGGKKQERKKTVGRKKTDSSFERTGKEGQKEGGNGENST